MKFTSLPRPWLAALLLAAFYIAFVIWQSGGPMGLVLPGAQFTQGDPDGSEGYDGQFVYAIARDPLGAAPYIDAPAYRYQRILYPLLARLLAFGRPALIAWALPLISLAALAANTYLTEIMLVEKGVSRWYALIVGLYAGQLLAARVDLPEPLALALSLGGMLAFARQKLIFSAVLFALAALTKESSLLFVAAYGAYLWMRNRKGDMVIFLAIATGPFILYQLILWQLLGNPGVGSGGANATPFELLPFAGLLRIAGVSWRAFILFSLIMLPLAIFPAIWSIWRAGQDIFKGHNRHPWVFALLANAAVIPFIPFSTFREPLAMLRFTIPLVACVTLYGGLRRSKRILFYSSLWLTSLIFLIKDPFI